MKVLVFRSEGKANDKTVNENVFIFLVSLEEYYKKVVRVEREREREPRRKNFNGD